MQQTQPWLESADPEGSWGGKCQTGGQTETQNRSHAEWHECRAEEHNCGLGLPVSKFYFDQLSATFRHLTLVKQRKQNLLH